MAELEPAEEPAREHPQVLGRRAAQRRVVAQGPAQRPDLERVPAALEQGQLPVPVQVQQVVRAEQEPAAELVHRLKGQ